MGYNGTYEAKYNFYSIFWILSPVHVVQHGVIIDKHAEIHLNDRKY